MPPLDIYIVTFNCGRALVNVDAFAAPLFHPYKDAGTVNLPDILVLSLQEIAPIAYSFLGGAFLSPYFTRILKAVQHATSSQLRYRHLITHNVGMTGIVVLAKPEIAARIQWTAKADVGVGFWQMGNKGAAGARLGYIADDSGEVLELTFVAAHLAPGEEQVQRRNQDWEDIVRGLAFTSSKRGVSPARNDGSNVGLQEEANPLLADESLKSDVPTGMFTSDSALFFAGDLNYRSSDVGPGEDGHTGFPQPTSDTTDPKNYSHLLKHDQLSRERKSGKTLHNLSEAPIHFPPTYKYATEKYHGSSSIQSAEVEPSVWYWAKHRFPSWCDRVLFSSYLSGTSGPLEVVTYEALPIQPTSDHRPVALSLRLDTKRAISAQSELKPRFPLDSRWREQRAAARRREIIVGLIMYLGWTWEGNGLVFATLVGGIGGWLVLRSLIG